MVVLVEQGGGPVNLVHRQDQATRLAGFVGWPALVVEEADRATGVPPYVVLESKVGPRPELEVVCLAAQLPEDLASRAVKLVKCPRVAPGDNEVAVGRVDADGIE